MISIQKIKEMVKYMDRKEMNEFINNSPYGRAIMEKAGYDDAGDMGLGAAMGIVVLVLVLIFLTPTIISTYNGTCQSGWTSLETGLFQLILVIGLIALVVLLTKRAD